MNDKQQKKLFGDFRDLHILDGCTFKAINAIFTQTFLPLYLIRIRAIGGMAMTLLKTS